MGNVRASQRRKHNTGESPSSSLLPTRSSPLISRDQSAGPYGFGYSFERMAVQRPEAPGGDQSQPVADTEMVNPSTFPATSHTEALAGQNRPIQARRGAASPAAASEPDIQLLSNSAHDPVNPLPPANRRAETKRSGWSLERMAITRDQLPPVQREASSISSVPEPGLQTEVLQQESVNDKENTTGLPDSLKTGVETLSGFSLDDVHVHYNSSKPAEVDALAYAQGSEIHVGPGQEQHLAHEAWHVVQQKQGRVEPTMQMQGRAINEDQTLEKEADVMGARANISPNEALMQMKMPVPQKNAVVVQRVRITEFNEEERSSWNKMAAFLRAKSGITTTRDFNRWKDNLTLAVARDYIREFDEQEQERLDTQPKGVDWLLAQINEAMKIGKDEVFVGYLGTSSVYQASIEKGINPPKEGTRGIAGEQLGYGLYLATQYEDAKHYAMEQHQNQQYKGKTNSAPIVFEVYYTANPATLLNQMREIRMNQWWGRYPAELDEELSVVSAPISGHPEMGPQLKFTEKTFAKLKARVVYDPLEALKGYNPREVLEGYNPREALEGYDLRAVLEGYDPLAAIADYDPTKSVAD